MNGEGCVAQIVTKLRALPGHRFWPDDMSLVGSGDIDAAKILTPAQITDTYLLALAKAHTSTASCRRRP
ncbi:hypothetical protein GCM10010869_03710 [Mesorhizobium tianshanense]|nr:hypothetical protein GCM10010869_03710 [Mesorhizobium tianshanense]